MDKESFFDGEVNDLLIKTGGSRNEQCIKARQTASRAGDNCNLWRYMLRMAKHEPS